MPDMTTNDGFELDPHWNYRVVRKTYELGGEIIHNLGIHEVYYRNGKPAMTTVQKMEPSGENLDELRQDLQWMLDALDKPILDYEKDFDNEESDLEGTEQSN